MDDFKNFRWLFVGLTLVLASLFLWSDYNTKVRDSEVVVRRVYHNEQILISVICDNNSNYLQFNVISQVGRDTTFSVEYLELNNRIPEVDDIVHTVHGNSVITIPLRNSFVEGDITRIKGTIMVNNERVKFILDL